DVGVVEGTDRLGFDLEASQAVGVRGDGDRQDLEGDVPAETRVPGTGDLPHSSRAHQREDLERADTCSDIEHDVALREDARLYRDGDGQRLAVSVERDPRTKRNVITTSPTQIS